MYDFSVYVALGVFFICLVVSLLESVRRGNVSLLSWYTLMAGGMYGLGWVFLSVNSFDGVSEDWFGVLSDSRADYYLYAALVLIMISFSWFGWLVAGGLKFTRQKRRTLSREESIRFHGKFAISCWLLFFFGVFLQWMYSQAYGGFVGILDYSQSIRSGIFHVNNKWSFLRPFTWVAVFSSFGFWGLILAKRAGFLGVFGFIITFIFSLYLFISWSGRVGLMLYIVTLIFSIVVKLNIRPAVLIFGGGVGAVLGLYFIFLISVVTGLKPAENISIFVSKEISYIFVSFFSWMSKGSVDTYRYFYDFLVAPLYLLPSSLWSGWVVSADQENTRLVVGAIKGDGEVTGSIPVDLLTLGYMQLSALGVLVVGFAFGFVLRTIQSLLMRIPSDGIYCIFFSYCVLRFSVNTVFYSDPSLVVSSNFGFVFSIILVLMIMKFLPFFRVRLSGSR